jgi:hypothetical protein
MQAYFDEKEDSPKQFHSPVNLAEIKNDNEKGFLIYEGNAKIECASEDFLRKIKDRECLSPKELTLEDKQQVLNALSEWKDKILEMYPQ